MELNKAKSYEFTAAPREAPQRPASYAWLITPEGKPGEDTTASMTVGPSGSALLDKARIMLELIQRGSHFRLVDELGRCRFTGLIYGKFAGPEPLRDFGRKHGCTAIDYDNGRQSVGHERSCA